MSAPVFTDPSELLAELGITEPKELEIEVIAQYCEATVVYKPLKGCAARITGNSDRAIITIDSQSRRERQRFSAAHELGHWMFDRGQVSYLSCEEAVFIQQWSKFNPETRANRYASDLLMPVSMFKPCAAKYKAMDFNTVKALCGIFGTSLTATAIRLVEHGPLPSMLVCSHGDSMVWFMRGEGTQQLWPRPPPVTHTPTIFCMMALKRIQAMCRRTLGLIIPLPTVTTSTNTHCGALRVMSFRSCGGNARTCSSRSTNTKNERTLVDPKAGAIVTNKDRTDLPEPLPPYRTVTQFCFGC